MDHFRAWLRLCRRKLRRRVAYSDTPWRRRFESARFRAYRRASLLYRFLNTSRAGWRDFFLRVGSRPQGIKHDSASGACIGTRVELHCCRDHYGCRLRISCNSSPEYQEYPHRRTSQGLVVSGVCSPAMCHRSSVGFLVCLGLLQATRLTIHSSGLAVVSATTVGSSCVTFLSHCAANVGACIADRSLTRTLV